LLQFAGRVSAWKAYGLLDTSSSACSDAVFVDIKLPNAGTKRPDASLGIDIFIGVAEGSSVEIPTTETALARGPNTEHHASVSPRSQNAAEKTLALEVIPLLE
jgi:hypothetical protein